MLKISCETIYEIIRTAWEIVAVIAAGIMIK